MLTDEQLKALDAKLENLKPACERCGVKLKLWGRPHLCPACYLEREMRIAAQEDGDDADD